MFNIYDCFAYIKFLIFIPKKWADRKIQNEKNALGNDLMWTLLEWKKEEIYYLGMFPKESFGFEMG